MPTFARVNRFIPVDGSVRIWVLKRLFLVFGERDGNRKLSTEEASGICQFHDDTERWPEDASGASSSSSLVMPRSGHVLELGLLYHNLSLHVLQFRYVFVTTCWIP